jgi:two-component system sensor histidine kinase/response regulator
MDQILVIDDQADLREAVALVLRENGYEVLEAEDGQTGVELAHSHQPSLILCDIEMPQLNGYQTYYELQRNMSTSGIPFIFLSARGDQTEVREGMTLGADDYIPKPFAAEDLLRAVDTQLRKRKEAVRKAERKLDDLRANISLSLPHELRTPLHSILGFSDYLASQCAVLKASEIREMSTKVHEAGTRLYRALENFLAYAQTEVLMSDPHKVAAIRKERVQGVHALLTKLAQSKAHDYSRGDDLTIEAVEAAAAISEKDLLKVVEELLDNAFKFSDVGTPISVSLEQKGNHLFLFISDQGRGMTKEQIENVGAYMQFERKFYEQKGFGLGLVLAKRMTELYGGELIIKSNPGEGTTMVAVLPAG